LAPSLSGAEITGLYTNPGGNNGDIQFNDNGIFGGISQSSFTIGGGSVAFSDLTDVDDSGRAINLVPKFNGTEIVWAAYDATFSFSIASFSDGESATVLIGTGVWRAAGALSFTATYTNGPPTGSTVTFSGWASALPMTGSFLGPTSSGEAVNYPSVGNSVVFTLSARKNSETDTDTETVSFLNRRFWGVSTVTSGFTEADVESFPSSELSNSKAKTFSVTAGASEYLVWASPTRLGTVTFFAGGFEGGFLPPETVSITNANAYTENYYVYRSVNSNLGTVNLVTE